MGAGADDFFPRRKNQYTNPTTTTATTTHSVVDMKIPVKPIPYQYIPPVPGSTETLDNCASCRAKDAVAYNDPERADAVACTDLFTLRIAPAVV